MDSKGTIFSNICKFYLYIWDFFCTFAAKFIINDEQDHTPMKRLYALLLIALMATTSLYAQKVYSTDHEYQAEVKVYVVDHEYQADLLVYQEDHEYQASGNEGKWYFVDHEYQADVKIYFVDHEYQADLKICFVSHEYRAGWRNNSKKHLMYGKSR